MLFNYALTSLVLSAVAYATPIDLGAVVNGKVNPDNALSNAGAPSPDAMSNVPDAMSNVPDTASNVPDTAGTDPSAISTLPVTFGPTPEQLQKIEAFADFLRSLFGARNMSEADMDEVIPALLRLDMDGSGPSQFFMNNDPSAIAPPVISSFVGTNNDGSLMTVGETLQKILAAIVLASSQLPTGASHTLASWMIDGGEQGSALPDITGPIIATEMLEMFTNALGSQRAVQFDIDPKTGEYNLSGAPLATFTQVASPNNVPVDRSFVLTTGLVPSDTVCFKVCADTEPCKAVNMYSTDDTPAGSTFCALIDRVIGKDTISGAKFEAAGGKSKSEQAPVSNSRYYNRDM